MVSFEHSYAGIITFALDFMTSLNSVESYDALMREQKGEAVVLLAGGLMPKFSV